VPARNSLVAIPRVACARRRNERVGQQIGTVGASQRWSAGRRAAPHAAAIPTLWPRSPPIRQPRSTVDDVTPARLSIIAWRSLGVPNLTDLSKGVPPGYLEAGPSGYPKARPGVPASVRVERTRRGRWNPRGVRIVDSDVRYQRRCRAERVRRTDFCDLIRPGGSPVAAVGYYSGPTVLNPSSS
jgi:hypothetical protein